MDALRPEDSFALEDLLAEGKFDMVSIERYIRTCQEEGVSFDLFDEKRPFLQSPYVEKWDAKSEKPVQALDYTVPSGNNHVHFDHRQEQQFCVSFAEAARLLPAELLFCTAGAQGYPSGVNASPPFFSVIRGENLFETLCYTLIPMDEISIAFDSPPVLWRRTQPVVPKEEVPSTSWLLGMLFPTRRIRLIADVQSGCVRTVNLSQGMNFVNKESWTDPCVTYRYLDQGSIPLRPNREKAIWRNFNDLIDVANQHAPAVLQVFREVCAEKTVQLTLYGVETSNASYLQIMRHTLTFPVRLTERAEYAQLVQNMIAGAELLARSLKKALTDPGVLPESVVSSAVQRYYDRCETAFWDLCNGTFGETQEELQMVYAGWVESISEIAREAYRDTLAELRLKAVALTKLSKAEYYLRNGIRQIEGGRQ